MTADDVTLTDAEKETLWGRVSAWVDDPTEANTATVEGFFADRLAAVQAEAAGRVLAADGLASSLVDAHARRANTAETERDNARRRLAQVEAGVIARLTADWSLLKRHHPVGAYLPVGQLDGDCKCGKGAWPCAEVRAALANPPAE